MIMHVGCKHFEGQVAAVLPGVKCKSYAIIEKWSARIVSKTCAMRCGAVVHSVGSVEFTFFRCLDDERAWTAFVPDTAEDAYACGFAPAMLIEAKGVLNPGSQWLQPIAVAVSMLVDAHQELRPKAPQHMGMWAVLTDLTQWNFFYVEHVALDGQQPTIFISKEMDTQLTCLPHLPASVVAMSGAGTQTAGSSMSLGGGLGDHPLPAAAAAQQAAKPPPGVQGAAEACTSAGEAAAKANPVQLQARHDTPLMCVAV